LLCGSGFPFWVRPKRSTRSEGVQRKARRSVRLSALRGRAAVAQQASQERRYASEPRPGVADARHLAREWSPRAVETLYDVMTNGAILRRARIASSGAVAQIFGSGSRVGGRSKPSRRAESILDETLRFSHEYRPVNRSHCCVRGGGDSGTSLLLASTRGY
jgi:hypothetical protein